MDFKELNARFETAGPEEILRWAIRTYAGRTGLSSSFGGESVGLIHMAIAIEPKIPILFVDTGFLFKETLTFVDEVTRRFSLNLRVFRATPLEIEQTKRNLEKRRLTGSPECCDASKIRCIEDSLAGLDCWVAGLRRSQSSTRKNINIIEEYRSGLVKVHPLANWTPKDLYGYMTKHGLPFHPLWERGYKSIGCEPCTALPAGGDDRSGRWQGMDKTECGIHTFMEKKKD